MLSVISSWAFSRISRCSVICSFMACNSSRCWEFPRFAGGFQRFAGLVACWLSVLCGSPRPAAPRRASSAAKDARRQSSSTFGGVRRLRLPALALFDFFVELVFCFQPADFFGLRLRCSASRCIACRACNARKRISSRRGRSRPLQRTSAANRIIFSAPISSPLSAFAAYCHFNRAMLPA